MVLVSFLSMALCGNDLSYIVTIHTVHQHLVPCKMLHNIMETITQSLLWKVEYGASNIPRVLCLKGSEVRPMGPAQPLQTSATLSLPCSRDDFQSHCLQNTHKAGCRKKNSHHAACVLFEREDFKRAFATSAIRKMNTDKAVDVGNFQQQGCLLQSGGKSR